MRDKAQEWLCKQIRKARIAQGQAENRPGVTQEELERLENKVAVLDWLLEMIGRVGGGWISVKERLPEPYADGSIPAVLVTDGEFIHMAYCSHNNWFFCENGEMKENMFYFVSHWMPLPEPPKEDVE